MVSIDASVPIQHLPGDPEFIARKEGVSLGFSGGGYRTVLFPSPGIPP
jgi:hypothetical protein